MKKIIRLTESDLARIVKQVIVESSSGKIKDRSYKINSDGTVSIKNNSNLDKKIRFSVLGSDINIKDISKIGDNYQITSKNNTSFFGKSNFGNSNNNWIIWVIIAIIAIAVGICCVFVFKDSSHK